MRSVERGFTFVELVVVIVILGILAATAVPRFIDVSTNARQAAVDGVAGAVASASAVNYGARSVAVANGTAVAVCSDAALTLAGGVLPTNYSFESGATVVPNGGTAACSIVFELNGASAHATATVTGIT